MSADPFALFGLPATPDLDVAALKERFARTTAAAHPDLFSNAPEAERREAEERYAALNRAYQTLIDPRARLLALYELTAGAKPRDVQRIPPGTMDLFIAVGQVCQAIDAYLARRQNASRLERAAGLEEEMTLQDQLADLRQKLEIFAAQLNAELGTLNLHWRAEAPDLAALETLYRKVSYLTRWRQQMEERELALLENG